MTTTQTPKQARDRRRQGVEPGATPEVVEAVAEPAPAAKTTKLDIIVELASRPGGASVTELMAATGWQAHSVRGALSGGAKKKLKLKVMSQKTEAGRVYVIAGTQP